MLQQPCVQKQCVIRRWVLHNSLPDLLEPLFAKCAVLQVSLMRQMEKSTKDFADWRKEREKEVMQLRRQVSARPVFFF